MSLRAKPLLLLALAAFISTFAPLASAAEIPIANIQAFHQGDSLDGDGSALDAINGTGMDKVDATDPSTWTVASTAWQDDWQGFAVPAEGLNDTWVVLDLGSPAAALETLYLWNVQENAPGNQSNRGVNEFEVFHATAPTVAPPATSDIVTPYDFASGGWTSAGATELFVGSGLGDAGLAYDVSAAAGARYIGLMFLSNHGAGDRVGLGEIVFTDVVDADAITLGEPVDPPPPPDPPGGIIPITAVISFHQGDSLDGDGSIQKISDASINTTPDPEDPAVWIHSNAWQDDWQGFEVPGVTENGTWAVLDLGGVVNNIGTLLLWNVNESTHPDRGMNEFVIHTATEPTVAPTATSDLPTPYDFSSGGWTAFGGTQVLAQASGITDEPVNGTFDLSGIAPARYIGIEILSNHGAADRVGFAHAVLLQSTSPTPRFEIVGIDTSEMANDRIGITWRSRPNQQYGVEFSTDLKTWIEASDNEVGAADSETTSYVEENPEISDATMRYYRIFEM